MIARLLLLLLPTVGCGQGKTPGDAGKAAAAPPRKSYTVSAIEVLPQVPPGVVLLATLGGDDSIEVSGTVQATLWEDIDGPDDERYAFRYRILDAAGDVLYARSTSGPVIVREFLRYYSDQTGLDILGGFPKLGTFAVQVPLLDDGDSVQFQLRQDDGEYETVGAYDLSRVEADDVGLSDDVTGTATLHEGGDPQQALDIVILPDGY